LRSRPRQGRGAAPVVHVVAARRVLAACAIVVVAAAVVQLALSSGVIGVSPDEAAKVQSLRVWLDTGWYVGQLAESGKPAPDAVAPYVYGAAFSVTGHALNVLVGNEAPGTVVEEAPNYRVLHMTTAMLGLLTAIAAGLATWCLTRSRLFALWGVAALLAIPAWLGKSFFQPKDIPVAAGYTFLTCGLVVALSRGSKETSFRGDGLTAGALVGVGVFFGFGTRFALWLPMFLSIGAFGVLVFLRSRASSPRGSPQTDLGDGAPSRTAIVPVAVGAVVGLAVVAGLHPKLFAHPITLLERSVRGSAGFPHTAFTLTAGKLLPAVPPWWYVPAWIGAALPLLIGAFALLGMGAAIRSIVWPVRLREQRHQVWQRRDLGLLLVGAQLLILPVAIVVGHTTIYGGVAKLLFVFPALAVFSSYGASSLWQQAQERTDHRWATWTITGLLSVALLVPSVEQIRLFPYNASYVNPVAGIDGVNGVWELATITVAGREAMRRVPAEGRLVVEPSSASANYFKSERGRDARPGRLRPGEFWLLQTTRSTRPLPDVCEPFDDVTRPLRGERVLLYHVARCRPVPAKGSTDDG